MARPADKAIVNRGVLYKYKSMVGCQLCGKKTGYLHFHHTDEDDRRTSPHTICNSMPAVILEEVFKCVVLCPKCHSNWHAKHKGYHGIFDDFNSTPDYSPYLWNNLV